MNNYSISKKFSKTFLLWINNTKHNIQSLDKNTNPRISAKVTEGCSSVAAGCSPPSSPVLSPPSSIASGLPSCPLGLIIEQLL